MSKYIKKGTVVAVQINLNVENGIVRYEKWGGVQTAKKGDWLIDNNGETYTCDDKVFKQTYEEVSNGVYRKFATIEATEADSDGSVKTLEGFSDYSKGDFIVTNVGGDKYCISRVKFLDMYERV